MKKPTIGVLTTQGSGYGYCFLNLLHSRKLKPDFLIVRKSSVKNKIKLFKSVARRIGWIDAFWASLWVLKINRQAKAQQSPDQIFDYTKLATTVHFVENFHSEACLNLLKQHNADFIFLAQTGIIKDKVIDLAKTGVLNAHPGYLPYFRGLDIPWWTLIEGKPELLGSSLHFVDKGIDTGAIVKIKKFSDSKKPPFDLLEERLYEDCIELMADAFLDISSGKELPKQQQEKHQGKQYFKMDRKATLLAKKAYHQWNQSKK